MRTLAVILLASIFLSLIACSDVTPELIEPIPEDTVITVESNPLTYTGELSCDPCRRFKVMLFADGTVIYDGVDSVGKIGVARLKITVDKVRLIIEEFEKTKFSKLRDTYDIGDQDCLNPVNHGSRIITSIQSNGKTKTIRHYTGCPNYEGSQERVMINELEFKIVEITGIEKWAGKFADVKVNKTLRPDN